VSSIFQALFIVKISPGTNSYPFLKDGPRITRILKWTPLSRQKIKKIKLIIFFSQKKEKTRDGGFVENLTKSPSLLALNHIFVVENVGISFIC